MKSAILFQNQPALEIADGSSRLIVAPEHGARILRWEKEGREIIHWPDDADWSHVLKVRGGNPILFPFIARHFVDGQPDCWRDDAGVVRPMPQHGFARDAKFAVIQDGQEAENCLRMRLTDSEITRRDYPFAFQFDVVLTLLPKLSLEIRFETTNLGPEPLPSYAGHHFYFAIPAAERAQWTLDLPCQAWGWQNPDGSVRREPPAASLLQLDDPALIDRFQVGPLCDEVVLRQSGGTRRLIMSLPHKSTRPWYAVTTWAPSPTSDAFCVEPWLGLPNAIHHGQGLRHVTPGDMETAACVLQASDW